MSKTGKYRFSAEDAEEELEDVSLDDDHEQSNEEREFESVDLGDETTPLLQGEKGSKVSIKEDIIKKLARLANVTLSKQELEGLKSKELAGANSPKEKAAQKIRNALAKKYGNSEIGNYIENLLSQTEGNGVDTHPKYEKAIDGLLLAEELEREADRTFSRLYKMAGAKKPDTINSLTIESLVGKLRTKYEKKYPNYDSSHYVAAQEEATKKDLEAKNLAETLKQEAALALSNNVNFKEFSVGRSQAAALLKGEGSVKAATHKAHKEYLKVFYPVRYTLGQIASSLSPFRHISSGRGNSSSPSTAAVNRRQGQSKGLG